VAGNKNPWRDILTVEEWQLIRLGADPSVRRVPIAPPHGELIDRLSIDGIEGRISDYHEVSKDDHKMFDQRITMLDEIAILATAYAKEYPELYLAGRQDLAGKVVGDQVGVWARSLARRATKKSGYLKTMAKWHQEAKAKYKDRVLLSIFLRRLAKRRGHISDDGEKLHLTPYATMEKLDPYHRTPIFFLEDYGDDDEDEYRNEMGWAFLEYLGGSQFPASTNRDPTFYEWLEYSPFCIGTPGLSGDARWRNPETASYAGHDLTHVLVTQSKLIAEQVISNPGVWNDLTTANLRPSGKGPPGAAAFVWDADCNLYLHSHGIEGFIHASAKQGKKIRCSGMLVAWNGIVTHITNHSGHYAPNAQSMYNFASWLNAKECVAFQDAVVDIHWEEGALHGRKEFALFMDTCREQGYRAPVGLPYPQQ